LDFLALQTELNARLHGNIANAAFLVQLKTWLNLGRKYIVALNPDFDFLQLKTTVALVADQVEYGLSGELVKLNQDEVYLTTTRQPIEFIDVRASGKPNMVSGTPRNFRLAGYRTIQIFPPPNFRRCYC